MKTPVTFTLNGTEAAAFAEPGQNLLDMLRRGLGDLSPKYGCGQGGCGACTVQGDSRRGARPFQHLCAAAATTATAAKTK